VCSIPVEEAAATRARWLAELAGVLDETQRLLARLDLGAEQQTAGVELFLRIEAARHEVQSLRLSRQSRSDSGPTWTNLVPWQNGDRSGA
jgi:hypothetical protein